jgi:hypothetical protein
LANLLLFSGIHYERPNHEANCELFKWVKPQRSEIKTIIEKVAKVEKYFNINLEAPNHEQETKEDNNPLVSLTQVQQEIPLNHRN